MNWAVLCTGLSTQVSGGYGSTAPSRLWDDLSSLDGGQVPFGSTAVHEPIGSLTPRV
ncbi:MAG TPA: hypothetical protein VNL13_09075 [Sulfolobales archaeon]|nr:hypothetical protein [Sulfolobales archaeon]